MTPCTDNRLKSFPAVRTLSGAVVSSFTHRLVERISTLTQRTRMVFRSRRWWEDHFQIGAVPVTLRTTCGRVARDYANLYDRFRVRCHESPSVLVEVSRNRVRPFHRRRYEVRIGGNILFQPDSASELLPYVEWAITWDVPRVLPGLLQLHAATLERDGMGLMLAGESGSGKSTLSVGLLTRGWRYFCDEFAMIDANTLMAHPYPRAICIKQSGYETLAKLGVRHDVGPKRLKGPKGSVMLVPPSALSSDAIGRPCPLKFIVFPKYQANTRPTLEPISRPEAVARLHRVCFNLLTCKRLGLDVLTDLVRPASCYQLISGDLGDTCELLTNLVDRSVQSTRAIA